MSFWKGARKRGVKDSMENSIYLGLARQSVLKTNMDIVSNNIANMNNGINFPPLEARKFISPAPVSLFSRISTQFKCENCKENL